VLVLALVGVLCPAVALAERTDVVVLDNGDRITGEVKELRRGRLRYKTDEASTVYIEWDAIAELTASETFEVETASAALYYGSLAKGVDEGQLAVVGSEETMMLDFTEVVRISPIKESFWGQFEGGFDLGFSLAQANNTTQYWLNFEAVRTRPRASLNFAASSSFNDQNDVEETERHSVNFSRKRLWVGRRFAFVAGRLESNEEVGIELRTTLSGGVGWQVKNTNRISTDLMVGLAPNREDPAEDLLEAPPVEPGQSMSPDPGELAEIETNLDLVFGLDAALFTYDYPETSIDIFLIVLPQISEIGRVRSQLEFSVKRELVKDLYWSVSLWVDYDNEPPTRLAEEIDYGLNTSFGYSF
jgi:hypothetical protein